MIFLVTAMAAIPFAAAAFAGDSPIGVGDPGRAASSSRFKVVAIELSLHRIQMAVETLT